MRDSNPRCLSIRLTKPLLSPLSQSGMIVEVLIVNNCLNCNKQIPKSNKFCNHSCSATFNNLKRIPKRACVVCSKPIHYRQKTVCSRACDGINKSNIAVAEIFAGIRTAGAGSRGTLRRYIIRTRGHRCECCKQTEWLGKPMPLELNHIDGNATNHSEENLEAICPNCHAQTPTYKGKNKGNGRMSRGVLSR